MLIFISVVNRYDNVNLLLHKSFDAVFTAMRLFPVNGWTEHNRWTYSDVWFLLERSASNSL